MDHPFIVWYNTKCPICNAGINWQRDRLARAARDGLIVFRDINFEPDALSNYAVAIADVRRRLHGVDADGRLYVGADCAIKIFGLMPGEVWLARILSLPIIRPLAHLAYNRFADALFAWNRWRGHW